MYKYASWETCICGCPTPGGVQGQLQGQAFKQPGLVKSVTAHRHRVWTRWTLRFLPTQTILQLHDYQRQTSQVSGLLWLKKIFLHKSYVKGRQGTKISLRPSHIEGYGVEATTPSSPHAQSCRHTREGMTGLLIWLSILPDVWTQ